jgi:hypothetical protein
MRLIDADALFYAIEEHTVKETGAYSKGYNAALRTVKSDIHNIDATPTVDAMPVVHGCWRRVRLWNLISVYECTVCKRKCIVSYNSYCHCGAKMDGGEDDGQ